MNPRLSTIFIFGLFVAAGLFFYRALSRGPMPAAVSTPASCPTNLVELSPEVKAYIDQKIAALPKGHDPEFAVVSSQLSMVEYQVRDLTGKLDFTGIREEMNRVLKQVETRAEEEKQRLLAARKTEVKSIMEEINNTCKPPEPPAAEEESEKAEGEDK